MNTLPRLLWQFITLMDPQNTPPDTYMSWNYCPVYSPPTESGLGLWLALTKRMWQKRRCSCFRTKPSEGLATPTSAFLGALRCSVRHPASLLERSSRKGEALSPQVEGEREKAKERDAAIPASQLSQLRAAWLANYSHMRPAKESPTWAQS